jgi:hypothetical protein
VNPNIYRTGEASDRLSEALPQNEIPIPVHPKSKKYMSNGQYHYEKTTEGQGKWDKGTFLNLNTIVEDTLI